jgi:hypothetical protein
MAMARRHSGRRRGPAVWFLTSGASMAYQLFFQVVLKALPPVSKETVLRL